MFKLSVCIFTLMCLTSCSSVINRLYGIKEIKSFDVNNYNDNVNKLAKIYHRDTLYTVISSVKQFADYQKRYAVLGKNNLSQPIQILYFQDNTLESYHLNCYAKGSISGNLDWNYAGQFTCFIPKSTYPIPADAHLKLSSIVDDYKLSIPEAEIAIVIFWTNMLPKHSYKSFEQVVTNLNAYALPTQKVNIVLINTDKFYIEENNM